MNSFIALFSFNRPDLFQRTLTALSRNQLADKTSLTIFCDGPRHEKDEPGTHAVRELAKKAQGGGTAEKHGLCSLYHRWSDGDVPSA